MTLYHFAGFVFILLGIITAGYLSGRKVKSAGDFSLGGRRAGTGVVVGAMVGSMVGGASTVGTTELAFNFGFSAWWYTLGSGLSCALLVFFAPSMYRSGLGTIPQVFNREYGKAVSRVSAILLSIGTAISIITQMVSGITIITSISSIPPFWSAIIMIVLMTAYVIFGGLWGVGYVGLIKTSLLYGGFLICGILTLTLQGGIASFRAALPAERYFNLFARGVGVDLGSCFSLMLGILSTPAYIQAIASSKDLATARRATFLSALLAPPIGLAGILIGLYMKINYPLTKPAFAMSSFILSRLPPALGGMILGVLLITVVGSGSGLLLGLGTMFSQDIYKEYINPKADDKRLLLTARLAIIAVLAGAAFVALRARGTIILDWGYFSTGFRAALACLPLTAALFLPGRFPPKAVMAAVILGPVFLIAGKIAQVPFGPVFLGLAVSFLVMLAGGVIRRIKAPRETNNAK